MQTIRTDVKASQFLSALSETGSVAESCRIADVARNSMYLWRKEDAEFARRWDSAVEFAGDLLEAEAFRRAHDGYEKPIYQGGVLVGTVREYSDTLMVVLLKGLKRERYGDKVEHSGKLTLESLVAGGE